MPDPITISEPETGALSPEQEVDAKDEALINESKENGPVKFAGKYESVQDLEKGYEELQKKLGSSEEGDKPEVSETKEKSEPSNATEIYGDHVGGTSNFGDRPELTKCLEVMESGDLLLISELSRLSRSFLGMVNEVSKLLERNIHIKTLDKRLDTTAMPKEITMLIVSILGYAASQELQAIKSRCAEGRAVAVKNGVKFGAKRKFDKFQIQEIMKKREEGQGYGRIGKALGISRSTIQKIVERERNAVVGIQ